MAKQEILSISNQPNNSRAFPKDGGATLEEFGIKHGDMLFFTVKAAAAGAVLKDSTEQVTTSSSVKEHPIDELLSKENGLIKRTKDVNFCRHGANGMCDYCMPLEPYDQKYLSENKIKHMSFQSYLRKVGIISTASNKKPSVSVMSSLEEPSFKVDPKCDAGHEPYPKSMCAKCQPSAVVLQQQTFRFIDHVTNSLKRLIIFRLSLKVLVWLILLLGSGVLLVYKGLGICMGNMIDTMKFLWVLRLLFQRFMNHHKSRLLME